MAIIDIFSQLKSLVGDKAKFLSGNNFDFGSFFNFSKTENHLHIDISTATADQIKKLVTLQPQFASIIQSSEDGYILDSNDTQKNLELVEAYSKGHIKDDRKIFVEKSLPVEDVSLWLSGLLLREQSDKKNMGVVSKIKEQMRVAGGRKGVNIANLCNEGYLSSHIIPLYLYLVEELEKKEEFEELYKLIVNEHIFAVFISSTKSQNEWVSEVLEKIDTVRLYGWNKVHVHAITESNVLLAKEVIQVVKIRSNIVTNIQERMDLRHLHATISLGEMKELD
jgi:hypothetical protein